MSERNLFEIASRKKYRFPSIKGDLLAEDLWSMPLQKGQFCLDRVAITLNNALKESREESFVSNPSPTDQETADKLDIVKHIIAVRKVELENAEAAYKRKETKQKIAAIMEQKKDEVLSGKSLEELEQLYQTL